MTLASNPEERGGARILFYFSHAPGTMQRVSVYVCAQKRHSNNNGEIGRLQLCLVISFLAPRRTALYTDLPNTARNRRPETGTKQDKL